jgi:hypothetical protein
MLPTDRNNTKCNELDTVQVQGTPALVSDKADVGPRFDQSVICCCIGP